jgi:hypothetical protein
MTLPGTPSPSLACLRTLAELGLSAPGTEALADAFPFHPTTVRSSLPGTPSPSLASHRPPPPSWMSAKLPLIGRA